MITVIAFIIVFGFLIVSHELGHFVTAKLSGVKVMEFGLGYPPRLWAFRRGNTDYSINLLPLGGFVKLLGEEDPTHPGSLAGKRMHIRALVLSAGAFMNAILPIVLFAIVFMVPQQTEVGRVTVTGGAPNSPAALAGIQTGDVILKVNGRDVQNTVDLAYNIRLRLGAGTSMLLERGAQRIAIEPISRWKPPEGQGAIGVQVNTVDPKIVKQSYPFWKAFPMGARRSLDTLVLAKNEIATWFTGSSKPQLAGPIGIAQITGEVAHSGISPLIEFTALLSLNLAIMNILPIPALDGGRLLLLGIEFVRRGKRIPPEREALVHMIGFALLIALVFVISYFDIARIIHGDSLLK